MNSSMNIDVFLAGMMSALKLTQQVEYPVTTIEEKIVQSFGVLEQLAHSRNIELRFHCSLNPYNKRSATVHYGLVRAEQSEMLKRDGHTVQILLTVEEAADIINASPLSLSEWKIVINNMKSEPFMALADVGQIEKLYEGNA